MAVVAAALGPVPGGLFGTSPAHAGERPKWELGVGTVLYTHPDYIGSDDYRFDPLPIPWLVYRGERLKMDRESIQARIFGTDLVRIDLSGEGQVSVDSDDNDRRRGMPNLDWILQLGPTVKFTVLRSDDGRHAVDVDVPLRAAFAVDTDNFSYEGLVSSPKLQYRFQPGDWRIETDVGLEFGNNLYHQYVYSVDPQWTTPQRPAYGADGGYAGWRVAAGVSRYVGSFFVGLFARYVNLEGATFLDSPLVATRHAVLGGVAIGWIWKSSDIMVPVGADAVLAARARPAPTESGEADAVAQEADAAVQEAPGAVHEAGGADTDRDVSAGDE